MFIHYKNLANFASNKNASIDECLIDDKCGLSPSIFTIKNAAQQTKFNDGDYMTTTKNTGFIFWGCIGKLKT